ncbi:MAG TPA: sigma-70 family RNA polymerase sigma factor [Urbifossiella sp.]|jgi:RNA polymerase sigma factor (sigma-70 family)|nr:sigma-70 family RNA polymerase sigma factor [Urbifossiella sp.]
MTSTAARLARLARLLPPPAPCPDGALLAAFLADRDETAFAELVRRHGPLVLAACRRLLPDPADAEDAFQAAFLVLVRRSHRLTGAATLGPWLYRVAAWTARNVRRRNARRLARTVALPDAVPAPAPAPAVGLDLDAALLALPEKYRTPLVLCHLQGWSRRDAAERLGYPEGTLSSLLARGLAKLRVRLRGYEPAAALAVGLTAVPAGLSAAAVSAATAARAAAAGLIPPTVAELAEGVLRTFWVQKATAAAVGLAVVFALGAGVGLSVREAPGMAAAPALPAPSLRPAAPPRPPAADRPKAPETDLERLTRERDAIRARLAALPDGTPPDQRAALEAAEQEAERRLLAQTAAAQQARADRLQERVNALKQFTGPRRVDLPAVTATLAVDVTFPDEARARVALAALDLVWDAAEISAGAPAAAWDAALRGCHVRLHFPGPTYQNRIPVEAGGHISIAEILVPLPLSRDPGGFVLVQDGGRIVRLSKYPPDACARLQEALAAAAPAPAGR